MYYIVVYDVPDGLDKLRTQIAQKCKDFGLHRLQYSMFFGMLTAAEVRELSLLCKDTVGENPVDIRFIGVCEECFKKSFAIIQNAQFQPDNIVKFSDNPLYSVIFHRDKGWGGYTKEDGSMRHPKEPSSPIKSNKNSDQTQFQSFPKMNNPINVNNKNIGLSSDITEKIKIKEENHENIKIDLNKTKAIRTKDKKMAENAYQEMMEITDGSGLSPEKEGYSLPEFNENIESAKKKNAQEELLSHSINNQIDFEWEEKDNYLTGKTCQIQNWDESKSLIKNGSFPEFQPIEEKYELSESNFKKDLANSRGEKVNADHEEAIDPHFLHKSLKNGRRHRGTKDIDVLII